MTHLAIPPTTVRSTKRATWGGTLERILEADLSTPRRFALLALFYYALRLPFINQGYGTDTDAWRVVMTAKTLLETGQYYPSRLPGNPLHELIMTPLVPGGWVATGLATTTASLIGVYIFARILQHLNIPSSGLMTICFAFAPLLFIHSTATIDFMWTLTLLLACYYCALRGHIVWAGVLLGLATGFRMQSPAFAPAIAVLLWRQGRLRELPSFTLAAAGIAAIVFAPVLVVYGPSFLNYYDAAIPYKEVIALVGKNALGVLGTIGVLVGAVFSWRKLRRLPADVLVDPVVASWVTALICYPIIFLRLPHQIGYLIPTLPFGLMLMARYYSRIALVGAVVCILLAGAVDVTAHGASPSLNAIRDLDLTKGLILANRETQQGQIAFVRQAMADRVPDHSYVMLGYIFPIAAVTEHDRLKLAIYKRDYQAISMLADRGAVVDEEHDIHYVWLMPYDAFKALRSQGYNFYVVPDAEGGVYALYGYRPTLFGASFLRLDHPLTKDSKGSGDAAR